MSILTLQLLLVVAVIESRKNHEPVVSIYSNLAILVAFFKGLAMAMETGQAKLW